MAWNSETLVYCIYYTVLANGAKGKVIFNLEYFPESGNSDVIHIARNIWDNLENSGLYNMVSSRP